MCLADRPVLSWPVLLIKYQDGANATQHWIVCLYKFQLVICNTYFRVRNVNVPAATSLTNDYALMCGCVYTEPRQYQLRAYIYQARNLLAGDASGLSGKPVLVSHLYIYLDL